MNLKTPDTIGAGRHRRRDANRVSGGGDEVGGRRRSRLWRRSAGAFFGILVLASCGSNTASTESSTSNSSSTESTTSSASSSAVADTTTPQDDSDGTSSSSTSNTEESATTSGEVAGEGGVLKVPDDFETIQAAVDAAQPGDLVLIAPGTYNEAVDVETDNIVIRGLDRDTVVLDGKNTLDNGVRVLGASGVAVENLTTMNYTTNGVYFVSTDGYRASYITTYRTGDYGIYAFDSINGQIEYSHTVGSRDAGVYVGQCYPCDMVIDSVVATNNGFGYQGTNSGGNLLIVNSDFHDNRVGVVPNSGSYAACYPARETTIVGNVVYNNNAEDTGAVEVALLIQRNGILVSGSIGNVIERNRVDGHLRTGIGVGPVLEEEPTDDLPTEEEWKVTCEDQKAETPTPPNEPILWDSFDNVIRDNVVTNSGEADIAIASAGTDLSTLRNCIADNEAKSYAPTALVELAPCDGEPTSEDWATGDLEVIRWIGEQAEMPGEVDWKTAELPELGSHENMPDPADAPAAPATDVPRTVDLAAIEVPELP